MTARSAAGFAGLLALTLATHTHALHRTWQCDNSLFLRYARDWAAGARLYADRYEPKTPAVFWLFRALDTPNPRVTLYLAAAGVLAVAANELRRATDSPFVAVLVASWPGLVGYHHLYDAFVLPLAALGVAWLGLAVGRRSAWAYPVASGAALAFAAGLFPPSALVAVAGVPLLVVNWRRNGRRAALTAALGFVGGVALVVGLIVGHAVFNGYWHDLLDVMAANRGYGSLDRVSAAHHVERLGEELARVARRGGPVVWVPVAVAAVALARKPRDVWLAVGAVWLVAALAGAVPGGRHFTHYYFPAVVPVAVLAGLGLSTLPLSPRRRAVAVALLAVAAVAAHAGKEGESAVACRRLDPAHERTGVRVAVAYLNQTVPPGDAVLVCTWERWAELYWQFDRPGPSRHVVPFNLPETRPELFAEWAEDVLADPPEWVITDGTTFGPGVTDDVIRIRAAEFGGALTTTPVFDRLRAFVAANYAEVIRAENLVILKRVTPGTRRP